MNFKGSGTSGTSGISGTSGPKRAYPDDQSSSPLQRSPRFEELLGKFDKEPHALSEHELNELVCECMFHGDVEALRGILAKPAAQLLHTLDIPRQADERAWSTLLGALPEPCSIKALKLGDQQFTTATAALFLKAAGRMHNLESLRLHSCNCNFESGELTCPPLPNLQDLHIENTGNPLPLVGEILTASQVSRFHFAASTMPDKDHASLAIFLSAQLKLQDLALRALQAHDQTLEGLFKHYIAFLKEETTMLTHLDLSGNKLSPDTCDDLGKVCRTRIATAIDRT